MLPPDAPGRDARGVSPAGRARSASPGEYVLFVARAARGDFGNSLREPVSAMSLVLETITQHAATRGVGLLIALVLGVLLGAIAAVSHRSGVRATAETAGLVGQMVPDFCSASC